MRDIFKPLRIHYLQALAGISYNSVTIPFDSDYLSKPKAILNGLPNVEAYGIIQSQNLSDDSAKCIINQDTQLQIDIQTWFPKNSGTYDIADDIADIVLQTLLPYGQTVSIPLSNGMEVWRAYVADQRNITEDNPDNRIFRHIISINHSITQRDTTT